MAVGIKPKWRMTLVACSLACALVVVGSESRVVGGDGSVMPWSIGGVGGAYLLVEPGRLEVEVFKRDLNLTNVQTDVRAILAGPDREVLAEAVIPHSAGRSGDAVGPIDSAVLATRVEQPGVFALNITTKGDRYGTNVAWGMRTNARGYVIETARGHRDVRHEEPIVLFDADSAAQVCFLPRPGQFEIEVEGMPADVVELTLRDEEGAVVSVIPAVDERSTRIRDYLRLAAAEAPETAARFSVPAAEGRGRDPWCLEFPKGHAYVAIDGVTRWESGDRFPDMAVWSPDPSSWFHFLPYRWLVSPYQRTVYLAADAQGSVEYRVHNNDSETRTVALWLECEPDLAPGRFDGTVGFLPHVMRGAMQLGARPVSRPEAPPSLSDDSVTLAAGASTTVTVSFAAPSAGRDLSCHLLASPEHDPEAATFAALHVLAEPCPADSPLDLPLTLRPYAHENRQFGYLPDYPVDSQPYFDLDNRPFVLAGRFLHRLDSGVWTTTDLRAAVVKCVPESSASAWTALTGKVAFDRDNDLYVLARSSTTAALLHSVDGGATFVAYVLPGREQEPRTWDLEQYSGNNVPDGPPAVVRLTRTYQETETSLRWRSMNDLDLFAATKNADGTIDVGQPMRVSDVSLGYSMHSGLPSTVVSRGSKVHVVWGVATDPEADRSDIPGVPTYVATYDRGTGVLGEPEFLSFGVPPNDAHNTPSITVDGSGYLHVLVGTHGQPFRYLRSLEPNDAYSGWTEPVDTSDGNPSQTYIGLVGDSNEVLHLVFRQWRSGEDHLDGALWAALAYQRKEPGRDWEPVRVLVAPPMSEYSIYYHRLTIDRTGALFLSYDYWSTMWFYRNDGRGNVAAASGRAGSGWGRAVITSSDGGRSWSLW